MIQVNQPEHLIGTWRRFGVLGPVYEIVGTGKPLADGDRVMKVRVLESGEEIDYRLSELLEDPKEQ
jgi:hypothetical protein